MREIAVADFWIDRTVTNRQFRQFVNETGHITPAELRPEAKDYPGARTIAAVIVGRTPRAAGR